MRQLFSIFGLFGLVFVGACQSSDISFLEPAPQQQAQNPITAQGSEASGPPRSLENPNANASNVAVADQTPAEPQGAPQPPQQTASDGEAGHAAGASQDTLSQGAPANRSAASGLSAAAGSSNSNPSRVEIGADGGGLASTVRHEVTNLLGGADNVRVQEEKIKDEMIVGNWNLAEEDGLRTCSMALAARDEGNVVQVTEGCSELMNAIREWGVFGEDLLLRDSENSVVVRLRQSADSWVGFTLTSGIPIVLTR